MSSAASSKKRKPSSAAAPPAKSLKLSTKISPLEHAANSDYAPLSLQDVYNRIAELCRTLPPIPESGFLLSEGDVKVESSTTTDSPPVVSALTTLASTDSNGETIHYDRTAIKAWATALQTILEEFHLLLACIAPATYVWGTDRSGAADQNLSMLSNELVRSQEQIAARVSPRLNDVLAPVVTLITTKTVTTKLGDDDKTEVKHNYYATTPEDPDYVSYCNVMLAKNATLMRHVVLANFEKLLLALRDYANAQHTDSQHDSRGLLY
ncbi:hypothetical protein MPSEU_001043200 [Mayamaea pseudoterrestris]|nr:hypothetical protein MPSEU_001043200 [Mayamaea pseudoterrestris]